MLLFALGIAAVIVMTPDTKCGKGLTVVKNTILHSLCNVSMDVTRGIEFVETVKLVDTRIFVGALVSSLIASIVLLKGKSNVHFFFF